MLCVASPGEKIRHLRETVRPRLTQHELAKRVGPKVSRNVIANIENGRTEPPEDITRKLSRLWGVPEGWFWDGGDVEPPPGMLGVGSVQPGSAPPAPQANSAASPGVGRRKFPVVGEAGAAEFPIAVNGTEMALVEDWVEFSDDLYRPDRYAIRVKGDSNEPRIKHLTYALIQPDPSPPTGLFIAARTEEHEYVVKILRMVKGRPELHPFSEDYPVLLPDEGCHVLGYVVGLREERGPGKYVEEGDNDGIRP